MLQPHRIRTFKRSNDRDFAEKVEDVVGLTMDPPVHAVVLSIDEKSRIRAQGRTSWIEFDRRVPPDINLVLDDQIQKIHSNQSFASGHFDSDMCSEGDADGMHMSESDHWPGLPLKPGKCGTMTHDDKRNGTTTLFAALDILHGTVIGRCLKRHRHQAFVRFLAAIERAVPAGKVIHARADPELID